MAAKCPAPKPLVYCSGDASGAIQDHIVSICTHPSRDLVGVGDIAGKITLYSYRAGEECSRVTSLSPQDGYSCRVLSFSGTGHRIFSGSSKRGTLYCTDTETGAIVHSLKAHRAPLYSILQATEKLLVTGNEEGEIKIWDVRSWKQVCSLAENTDFISDMAVDEGGSTLLATSGDGSLTAVDLKQRKLLQRSDTNESELLSLAIVKNGNKVVCGDGGGALMIYNWDLWSDITDRYPVHPQGIDCILPLNSSVVCTGCMDGCVRSVQILPNTLLGSVGQHSSGFPVEAMCMSHDRQYVISSCHDACHFWPTSDIPTLALGELEGGEPKRKKRKRKQKHRDLAAEEEAITKKQQHSDFFADL